MRSAKITAVVFLLGGATHLLAFALLGFGIEAYGHGYPPLRHVLMASIDLSVGWIGIRQPAWLAILLPVYVLQRVAFNGLGLTAILATVAWAAIIVERRLGVEEA